MQAVGRQRTADRLGSLAGVVPVGAFFVIHLYLQSAIDGGPAHYDRVQSIAGALLHNRAWLLAVQILLVWLPLAYHAVWGIGRIRSGRATAYPGAGLRRWFYALQRWTGVFLVPFLLWHGWFTWRVASLEWAAAGAGPLPGEASQIVTLSQYLAHYFSQGGFALVAFYAAGVFASAFHFANGLWNFGVNWGITSNARAMRWSTVVCAVVFAVLFVAGTGALADFVQLRTQ